MILKGGFVLIEVDKKELEQYKKNLENTNKYAYPKTVRSTLDRMAFLGKKEYDKNVKKELTIRGSKTKNIVVASIGYEKCQNTLHIENMEAFTGQFDTKYGKKTEQLKAQEFGETLVSKTKYTVKPTKTARSGNNRKLVSRENNLAGMDLKRISDLTDRPSKDIKKQFAQAVGIVQKTIPKGKFIHFLPDDSIQGKKFGVFRLISKGSFKDESGKLRAKKGSVQFMYSFKDKTQTLNPRPMLEPATDKVITKSGEIFVHEAKRRIEKEMKKNL